MTSTIYYVRNAEGTVGAFGNVKALAAGLMLSDETVRAVTKKFGTAARLDTSEFEDRLREMFPEVGTVKELPEFGVKIEYLPILTVGRDGEVKEYGRPGRKGGQLETEEKEKAKGQGKKRGRPKKNTEPDGVDVDPIPVYAGGKAFEDEEAAEPEFDPEVTEDEPTEA